MAVCSISSGLAKLTLGAAESRLSASFSTNVSSTAPLKAVMITRASQRRHSSLSVTATSAESPIVASLAVDPVAERKYPPFAAFKIHGTGRRKTAVARVGLIEGTGNIIVNGLPLRDYFQNQALMIQAVRLPLTSLGYENKYDIVIKAHGGGLNAQAQAMVLGIARALVEANATNRPPLKAQGMLTRDARAVERKKYGLKKARKAPQFSKR